MNYTVKNLTIQIFVRIRCVENEIILYLETYISLNMYSNNKLDIIEPLNIFHIPFLGMCQHMKTFSLFLREN